MIKELLQQSKYRVFNVSIAKAIGLKETLVLMELADAEHYFSGGEFFLTYEQISENTTLSEKQIRACVKNLKDLGIIVTYMKGVPAKQHYILNMDKLAEIIEGRSIPTKNVINNPTKNVTHSPTKNVRAIYKEEKEPINKQPINKKPNKVSDKFIKDNLDFNELFLLYTQKGSKELSKKRFKRFGDIARDSMRKHIPEFINNHKVSNRMEYLPAFQNYIKDKRWLDPKLPYNSVNKSPHSIDKEISKDPNRLSFD